MRIWEAQRDLPTRVIILKLGEVIDVLVYDDPQIVRLVMRRNVALGEYLGHVGRGRGEKERAA
jgi:hypothetical protein